MLSTQLSLRSISFSESLRLGCATTLQKHVINNESNVRYFLQNAINKYKPNVWLVALLAALFIYKKGRSLERERKTHYALYLTKTEAGCYD